MKYKIQEQYEFFYHIVRNYDLFKFDEKQNYFEDNNLSKVFKSIVKLNGEKNRVVLEPTIIREGANETISIEDIKSILNFIPTTPRELLKFSTYNYTEWIFAEYDKKLNELDIEKSDMEKTPIISKDVYENLPIILKDLTDRFKNERERDIILLTSITTISTLFDNLYFRNSERNTKPNIYTFIGAPASNGKGVMTYSKYLLDAYLKVEEQDNIIIKSKSIEDSFESKKNIEPKIKSIFLPGDSSSAAFVNSLHNNEGKGLIFAEEISEISGNNKQEWGNYDGFLRKSFHNESISINRKGSGLLRIDEPYISVCASGTLDQLVDMFGEKTENGLFSRTLFYLFETNNNYWERDNERFNIIKGTDTIKETFIKKSNDILKMFETYKDDIEVVVNMEQWDKFNNFFEKFNIEYITIYDGNIVSSNRRMASICKRLIMIFSLLRHYETLDKGFEMFNITDIKEIIVEDIDLEISIKMVEILMKHTTLLFNSFEYNIKNKKETIIKADNKQELLDNMGDTFTTKEIIRIGGEKYKISDATLERYLNKCVSNKIIKKVKRGEYIKIK